MLKKHEIDSALWQKLEAHLKEKLTSLRAQNDAELGTEATSKLRGRIAEVKSLLSLGEIQETVQQEAD
jgi:hypothetical protein